MKNITKANTTNATPADGNAERSYRKALKRERDRARSKRQYRQGKFEASLLSLDRLIDSFEDPSKLAAFSDGEDPVLGPPEKMLNFFQTQ